MGGGEQKTGGSCNNDADSKHPDRGIELADNVDQVAVDHREALSPSSTIPAWKSFINQDDGDTALALFENIEQLNETVDPVAERKLVRKIDLLILPCLIVCYTFYYVSFCISFSSQYMHAVCSTLNFTIGRQNYFIICCNIWN